MPRKPKTPFRQYGEPTEMIAVRVPAALHTAIKAKARKGGMPKSRKVVELLEAGLAASKKPAVKDSVFE